MPHSFITFALYTYSSDCCLVQEWTIMSWTNGNLQLQSHAGPCFALDYWAIHLKQWWYSIPSHHTPWDKCGLQWCCSCKLHWLGFRGHPHKSYQPHDCTRCYAVWYGSHHDIHCYTQTEWDSGAVQGISCTWNHKHIKHNSRFFRCIHVIVSLIPSQHAQRNFIHFIFFPQPGYEAMLCTMVYVT